MKMKTDTEYLQCLGLGLQGLRASGQFCDAMVCVGSTRILVHKVVLSAASKTLHDLALEFDMTPHRERDQLEIIIPSDVSLFAVNMFINYLYTGQLDLNERVVNHLLRLSGVFGVTSLGNQCREFIQKATSPDSQDLNLQEDKQTEPDSSCPNGVQLPSENLFGNSEDATQMSSHTRSSSRSSGIGFDQPAFASVSIKSEPIEFDVYSNAVPNSTYNKVQQNQMNSPKSNDQRKQTSSMSVLEKLMSPVVNIKKLPSNITPDVVVLVSDDDCEMSDSAESGKYRVKKSHYSLEEKEAIAREAKRFGTTHVSRTRNIPLTDILSWITLFGLRHSQKPGKQVNHEADLSIVRWILQQQELKGQVDLNSMKNCSLNVYRQTNPNFTASKTWLENFLRRNMSVLQGTQFVADSEVNNEGGQDEEAASVSVKKEILSMKDLVSPRHSAGLNQNVLEGLGNDKVLESVGFNEEMMLNDDVLEGFEESGEDDYMEDFGAQSKKDETSYKYQSSSKPHTSGNVITPFGKRPIIIGQAKSFNAKSERKIVQWVLERNERDGYVFTDDFKDYAKSLYEGSKPFGATQAWMKKFLRRNRVLKDVKFCSKYKNMYTNKEKEESVSMARRFGVTYASKHTGINPKVIHSWKLAIDRGQLSIPSSSVSQMSYDPVKTFALSSMATSTAADKASYTSSAGQQAVHGIVPEFEQRIISMIKEFQAREGSINYNDISQMSQSVYKETRPTFKASYSWIKIFLDRHKEELKDIELENVSKVLFEETDDRNVESSSTHFGSELSKSNISELVDNALMNIDFPSTEGSDKQQTGSKRPIIVGPSVTFNRKTEKQMVEWALEQQALEGYVFTDDFKEFAKSLHTGPKHFSASSGWMSLFLRRHRVLKDVKWKSKFKNNYTEDEKKAAVGEAKRLGTGHVGRKLGIDPALICAWRIKMEKAAQKHTFWKGTKIKFGKGPKPIQAKFAPTKVSRDNDAARGIVPEFEQRIVDLILNHHAKEGSISYEEISRISQEVYKETRSNFKASYAWIRNFMKRHENELGALDIDNVKKVFIPESEENNSFQTQSFTKRPIIIGQSRSLDTKSEKKLVEWVVEQQARDGYVFLDQFKKYAKSLYQGNKKFAATQAWRIKFMRRNHAAIKHVRFTSSFRNQYDPNEKKAIVEEAKKYGVAHVAKKTGIDHCLINAWRLKMEKNGEIPGESNERVFVPPASVSQQKGKGNVAKFASHLKKIEHDVGPGLYSVRGVVPQIERKIVELLNDKMDDEGSVSYQDVSNIAKAVYKETRPNFKACYNWIKEFIKRNKKGLKHVDFENTKKVVFEGEDGTEILISEEQMEDINSFVATTLKLNASGEQPDESVESWDSLDVQEDQGGSEDPMIVIDNPEDPNYDGLSSRVNGPMMSTPKASSSSIDIENIAARKPVVVGTPVHFTRKTEKKLVEWLMQRQARDEFVFTDDFRDFARTLYTGPTGKFSATNAWIAKFLKRNRLEKKVRFESRLKGNNPKYEEKIIELILEKQRTEGSVSNDDIQKITTDVYKDIRPNFRACYNWIRDFIKRHKDDLGEVELENVKRVFIPDEDNDKDGVIIRDYDPTRGFPGLERSYDDNSLDASWTDVESSSSFDRSRSQTPQRTQPTSVLDKLSHQKRPVIIAPPKTMDVKTEKRLVQWMLKEQEKNGCVYLDLFKLYAKSIHTGPKHFAATQAWMVRFKQRNHEALKIVKICSRFRKEYTIEEKMAAVEEARRLGCNHVGRKLGINGGVIYSWKIQLEQAEKLDTSGEFRGMLNESDERESSRGQVPEFEDAIVVQVLELQKTKGSIAYEDVSRISRDVYKETRPNFKASYNWVLDFIRKYKDRFECVKFENQRKIVSEEEKLHILSEEKKYGTEHVIKKRNISASTIYNWKKSMQAKSIPIPNYKALVGSKIKKKYVKGKKFKNSYTLDEKRNAVAVAEANGITYAHLKLGVSRNVISKWVKYFRDQGENIVINYTHAATVKKDLLQKAVTWVLEQNAQIGIVLTHRIQEFTQKLFDENFCNFNATRQWLESFIQQNTEKFKNVRFRERDATDLDFTENIKLKLARYAEKHGAVSTAAIAGVSPNNVYHWRRMMKQKGHNLLAGPECDTPQVSAAPQSLMQQKLDKIAEKFSIEDRKSIVAEANSYGTSIIASKYKIPLPLLLKWMKIHSDAEAKPDLSMLNKSKGIKESTPETKSHGLLKVRLPSVERAKTATTYARYSDEFKRQVIADAREIGIPEASRRKGIPVSTLYNWWNDFERKSPNRSDRKSVEKSRKSVEPVHSNKNSDVEETKTSIKIKTEPEDDYGMPATPSGSFADSGSDGTPQSSSGVRYVRKYSEEEKVQVVQQALKLGVKQASVELDVPLSNVRRWTSMFQKRMKFQNMYKRNKEQKLTSANQFGDASDMSGITVGIENIEDEDDFNESDKDYSSENNVLSRMLHHGLQNQSQGVKRIYSESGNESNLSKKRKISAKYSHDQKIEFVRISGERGGRYAAQKAGVSMDVLYKWRQKFLSRTLQPPNSLSTSTVNDEDNNSGTIEQDENNDKIENVLSTEKNVLEKGDVDGETLIEASDIPDIHVEASDIPDISVPPFSSGNDMFAMNTEYLHGGEALDRNDDVIFPDIEEFNVVKNDDCEPVHDVDAKQGSDEPTGVDLIKIVNVKSECSSQEALESKLNDN